MTTDPNIHREIEDTHHKLLDSDVVSVFLARLEDEYYPVRLAALDAIGELAKAGEFLE